MPAAKKKLWPALGVCLASGGLALVILFAVYALRGIWPFGPDSVSYIDSTQFFLPDYYALWDAMHGGITSGLNWYAGLAESGSTSWSALLRNNVDWLCFLNPANWVFLFCARDQILEGLNLYLAVYVAMTSASAALALHLRFPNIGPWKIIFSQIYALSGYVLQYYFSFGWFLVIILFPFLLLGLESLLQYGRYILYTVCYTLLLCMNVYFAYMVTVYILLFSFGYCVFLLPKNLRGDRILRLGLSTVVSFCIGACFWIQNLSSFTGTSRFDTNLSSGLIKGFSTWNIPYTANTTLMLLGTALLIALFIRRLRQGPSIPNAYRFFGLLLTALLIPMVFTNVDTAWHFGQYNLFPMRYGFMLPATMIAAAAAFLDRDGLHADALTPGIRRWLPVVCCILAVALFFLQPRLVKWFHTYGSNYLFTVGSHDYWLRYFTLYVGCGILFTLLYLCLSYLPRPAGTVLITVTLLLQLGSNAFGLIAADDSFQSECDPCYVDLSDALYNYFSEQNISPLSRAKNTDNSLNNAYPVLAGVSALSSANSLNSSERLALFDSLGYTTSYFRILDTGGTVFTDMLFGVDTILSAEPLDESLYTDTGTTIEGIHIGKSRYAGLVGLTFPSDTINDIVSMPTLSDRINTLYSAFTDTGDTLADTLETELSSDGISHTLQCTLDNPAFLYIRADCVFMNLTVNGRSIGVPVYMNAQNKTYPASFNHNLLYLGKFDTGTVTLQFSSVSAPEATDISVTALYTEPLDHFRANAHFDENTVIETDRDSVHITLTTERDGMSLFLPITYSERWQCTVNGIPTDPVLMLDTLMSIPLNAGENEIFLQYQNALVSHGLPLIVSIASLILFAAWLFLRRHPAIQNLRIPAPVLTAVQWVFFVVCIGVLLFIYAAPMALLLLRGSIVCI